MKVKVSEATGPVLDWLAAKAMGYKPRAFTEKDCGQSAVRPLTRWCGIDVTPGGHTIYSPSTNPAQGWPIIERKKLSFREERPGLYFGFIWDGAVHRQYSSGPTALVAAMRCFVASELGDEVDVPEELLK